MPWSFNPLLIGEAAPPTWLKSSGLTPNRCFNPLLIGEAAPPYTFSMDATVCFYSVLIPFSSGRRRRLCPRVPRLGEVVATCFNPLLIGEAAPPEYPARRGNLAQLVSIPFSSGRRRRRRRGMACHVCSFLCFNPLLIGEAAPPMLRLRDDLVKIQVSIPFSSGRRRRPSRPSKMRVKFTRSFQSPSHRGGGAAVCPYTLEQLVVHCFNPLLIGEAAPPMATSALSNTRQWHQFQSPSHRGGGAAPLPGVHTSGDGCGFNPLLIGEAAPPGNRRNRHSSNSTCFNPLLIGEAAPPLELPALRREAKRSVSIPFSSGRRRRPLTVQGGMIIGNDRFNPLLIGEAAPPNRGRSRQGPRCGRFQSPSHRGGGAATYVSFIVSLS